MILKPPYPPKGKFQGVKLRTASSLLSSTQNPLSCSNAGTLPEGNLWRNLEIQLV